MSLLYEETTGKIIGAFYKVHSNLVTRAGCSQENDDKALGIEMRQRGLRVREQYFVHHKYQGRSVGLLLRFRGRLRESTPVKTIWSRNHLLHFARDYRCKDSIKGIGGRTLCTPQPLPSIQSTFSLCAGKIPAHKAE
jgi:hypothetical protein